MKLRPKELSPLEYQFVLGRDFTSFNQRAFHELNPQTKFIPASYIEAMASKLEKCRLGRLKRLIIMLPPRYLKSHTISVSFVAWCLGHHPSKEIICASYGQELSDKLARDTRTLMSSPFYKQLFPTRLGIRQTVHDFDTTARGGRMATSVGGVLTGRGADIIILDDPLKPADALSETARKAVKEWFDNTVMSRLNNKEDGVIIIVMQRLHQDDLVGHVLQQGHWDILSFPAIAEDDESHLIDGPLGHRTFHRKAGEALHPERESLTTLERIKREIGSYNFQSQYQQDPMPIGGNLVKREWFRYYDWAQRPARFDRIVQSWDTATKAGELNDYSVCTTWGTVDGRRYLLDVFRKKVNYPDLKRAVIELANFYKADTILVEDKSSGTQLIQDLGSELGSRVVGYKPPPGTDKQVRLHAQTAVFESGGVWLPTAAAWLDDYIAELIGFPGTRHDDQVDSTTQALDHMREPDAMEIWRKLGEAEPDLPLRYRYGF